MALSILLTSCVPQKTARIRMLSGEMSAETIQIYQNWKVRYVEHDTYVTDEIQYFVRYLDNHYSGNGKSVPVTVSEAHGYGMLIMAYMADYDPEAKDYFDGMYRYYAAHLSDIGPHLMSWQQCDNGTALIDGAVDGSMRPGPADSATDGDMDVAYALLLADEIWGSDGDINYLDAAVQMINDIMKYEVNPEYKTLMLGDWACGITPSDPYANGVRCSDFILSYLPVFAEVTGDEDWLQVYENTYQIINSVVESNGNGLLPDFMLRNSYGIYVAAYPGYLEGENDGLYGYNSCRTPWRIGMDYLVNRNEDAKQFAETITEFIKTKTDNDPWKIKAGYDLTGNVTQHYEDLCFLAPFLVAAACTEDEEWHDAVRSAVVNYGEDVYYGDSIRVLCLIADDMKR